MKPIAACAEPHPKPDLPPKPKFSVISPSPQDQKQERDLHLPSSPTRSMFQPPGYPPSSAMQKNKPHIVHTSPRQVVSLSYYPKASEIAPKTTVNGIENGNKLSLTEGRNPVRSSEMKQTISGEKSADSHERRAFSVGPLGGNNVSNWKGAERKSESMTSATENQSVNVPSSVTSSEGVADVIADVIYDEPFAEFERKSLQRMIKSDGYVKLRSDVIEETESLKREAMKHRKSRSKKKQTMSGTRVIQNNPDPSKPGLRPCRSSESVDKLDVLLDFSDCSNQCFYNGKPLRSSFVDPNGPPTRKSVYIELGEYQTLLKHSRNDDERVYSLPQPQCYGEDTLKAVKLITEKYDTFKRRQLRALSFREGTCTSRISQDADSEAKTGLELIPQENNNNSKVRESTTPSQDPVVMPSENESHPDGKEHELKKEAEQSTDTTQKPASGEISGKMVSTSKSRPSGWLVLRDYCNTLAADSELLADSNGGLSRGNLMRIELFYRSREAMVYVCRSLADMFIGTCVNEEPGPFVHQHTGVPVWLLNSGEGVRSRELLLVVAERETGLPLWQDKINYLSNYHEVSPGVHSLRVSGSLRKMVRLDMFCERSGSEFLARFQEISSDPQDDLWKVSSNDSKAKKLEKKKRKKMRSRFSKTSISQPCNFVHISCVDPSDPNFRAAFSGLIPIANGRGPSNIIKDPNKAATDTSDPNKNFEDADDSKTCEFRPRLPTR